MSKPQFWNKNRGFVKKEWTPIKKSGVTSVIRPLPVKDDTEISPEAAQKLADFQESLKQKEGSLRNYNSSDILNRLQSGMK